MAVACSRSEVLKLIELWGDSAIQAQLEGCKRNQDVYDKISSDLHDTSFERTGKQCREKIKKLKGEYRKIKDKRNETGEERLPEWDYFDSMDVILGHRPATQPPVIVNSLEEVVSDTTGDINADESIGPGNTVGESQLEKRGSSPDPELEDFQPTAPVSSSASTSR